MNGLLCKSDFFFFFLAAPTTSRNSGVRDQNHMTAVTMLDP